MAANATAGGSPPPFPIPAGMNLADSQQGELRITVVAMTVLATLFVALRFSARIKRSRVGADDYMLLFALIHYGLGLHAPALSPGQLTNFLKEVTYVTTNGLIKVALLMMYSRIFTFQQIKWAVLVTGFMSVGLTLVVIPVAVFQCNPIEKAWNPFMPGSCIKLKEAFIATGALNILNDSMILCIPMPLVWRLHANMWRRLSLVFIFSLGSFVVFASIYRFYTIFQFDPHDTTWTLATAVAWCLVECAAGIISCCLPTLRPLLAMVFSGFRTTQNNSGPSDVTTVGGSGPQRFRRVANGNDNRLRPPYEDTVMNSIGRAKSDSGLDDEILLTGINVRTEVEWSESSPATAPSPTPSSVTAAREA